MSNIQALMLARARPVNLRQGEIDKYLTLLENILQQSQNQTGTSQNEVKGIPDVFGVLNPAFSGSINNNGVNLEYTSTGMDYTAYANEFIRCTAALTVTLNPEPEDQEQVFIQVYGGFFMVTILGNVNGNSPTFIHADGDCVNLVYSLELDQWVIQ